VRTRELRRQARRRLDGLSREHLLVADRFLGWLEDRESIEATEELLSIPGFLERFQAACREADEGKLTAFEEIDWKDEGADP
jgi:hypothetical protein